MNLVLATELRIIRDKDGNFFSQDNVWNNQFIEQRYLKEFDYVFMLARVKEESQSNTCESKIIGNDKILVIPLPHYIGPWQYLLKHKTIKKIIKENAISGRTYIVRCPGVIATLLADVLTQRNIPYGVEVVGDPYDVFRSINHPLSYYFRYKFTRDTKRIVQNASSCIYVTKEYLQRRYRPSENVFTTYASNVILRDEFVQNTPRRYKTFSPIKLISIGTLEQMYKAPDIVLKTIAKLISEGIPCYLQWLGEGKYLKKMEQLAMRLGVEKQVSFVGSVTREKIWEYLDNADLFLLVSTTEGLPRALIEAMARALPCIGSNVGGIPELLNEEAIVPPNNFLALSEKIKQFFYNPKLYENQSATNIKKSKEYLFSVLEKRRVIFFRELMERSK
jgi:glycosyltransferase involved in cell wall biosynthesis